MTRAITLAAALSVAATGSVFADERYDRNLEKAVMKITASRIGMVEQVMRGSFAIGEKPAMTSARELGDTGNEPEGSIIWTDGLARAVEAAEPLSVRPNTNAAEQTGLRQ